MHAETGMLNWIQYLYIQEVIGPVGYRAPSPSLYSLKNLAVKVPYITVMTRNNCDETQSPKVVAYLALAMQTSTYNSRLVSN